MAIAEPGSLAAPAVSLVIPVYNEAENVPILHGEIHAVLEPTGLDYEILCVDDGSTDAAPRRCADCRRRPALRSCAGTNSGQSAALDAGFWPPAAPIVVTLDADLQNDPADIPRLLARARRRRDVVSRGAPKRQDDLAAPGLLAHRQRGAQPGDRRAITDVGCSLKAYRRRVPPAPADVHRHAPLPADAGALETARAVREIPVNHRPRLHGTAKYGIGNRLFRALADLMAVRWMRRRWIDPRRVEEIIDGLSRPLLWSEIGWSSVRPSSSAASSCSGWPPSAANRAWCRTPSGISAWAAALVLLIYAIHRREPVFVLGQAGGLIIYCRNL